MLLDEEPKLPPGQTIASYQILSFISRGGMGEVYLAQHRRLNRKVALKILPACSAQDQDRLRRFESEAQAASALNHPNILTIHEIGDFNGRPFIATEFVEGETLRQRIAKGPLPLGEVLDLGEQIASALAVAHDSGIIHRDIKPDNVMVRRDMLVKVLDFGLAKLTETEQCGPEDPTRALINTIPGTVMGTLTYMSPEQARGLPVDTRTDLWSLGVVLYEMIVGRPPFEGTTTSDVLVSVLEREPTPLTKSCVSEAQLLQPIIDRALCKNREGRYQTATEMISDFRSLKTQLEKGVRPIPETESGNSATVSTNIVGDRVHEDRLIQTAHARNYATLVRIVGPGIGIVLVIALLYGWSRNSQAPQVLPETVDSLAVLPLVNSGGDAAKEYLADGITESLINSLADLDLKVMSRNSVFRFKGNTNDAQTIARQLGVRGVVTGNVREINDELVINVEVIDAKDGSVILTHRYVRKSSDLLAMQSNIAQDVAEKLRVKLSSDQQRHLAKLPTLDPEAYQLYLRGRANAVRQSSEALHSAIAYYQQAVDRDPMFALAYSQMAQAYLTLGLYFEAPKEIMPLAKSLCMKALQIDDSLVDAHITLGTINLIYDWDFEAAEHELRSNDGLNPKAVETFSCSAHILESTGRGGEAEREIRRALLTDPLSVPLNTELGCTSYYSRNFDASIEENRDVLQLDPQNPLAYWGLARAFGQKQMYQDALDALNRVEASNGKIPIIVAETGYIYAASGRKAEALKVIKELGQMSKKVFVDPYLMAEIYAGVGAKNEALTALEKSFDLRSAFITSMKSEPKFDGFRNDPRFTSLLERVGFKA